MVRFCRKIQIVLNFEFLILNNQGFTIFFEEDSRQIRIPKKDFVSTVNTTAEFVLIVNFVI